MTNFKALISLKESKCLVLTETELNCFYWRDENPLDSKSTEDISSTEAEEGDRNLKYMGRIYLILHTPLQDANKRFPFIDDPEPNYKLQKQ